MQFLPARRYASAGKGLIIAPDATQLN